MQKIYILCSLFVFAGCSTPKSVVTADTQTLDNITEHIKYLSNDSLEGRRAGSEGEKKAGIYICGVFKRYGLTPKGTDNFYQPFEINDGKMINTGTMFSINGNNLTVNKDFFPFPFSANQTITALPAIAIQESDMPWFIDLKDILDENKANPHFDLVDYIKTNAMKAMGKGASAVILYNTSATDDKLVFDPKDRNEKLNIPVIYINKSVATKYFNDPSATLDIKFKTDIGNRVREGQNIIGYLNNGADQTVILGAHFDHLGYGEDGNSLFRTGEKAIHNGADDNASGTAALMEIARLLRGNKAASSSNYLFVAFSGEELGLFGSKFFVDNPTIDLKSVRYMINMDMVGRLNDSTRVLTVGGIGTSPAWADVLPAPVNDPGVKRSIIFRYDSSGTGPSDHSTFYRKDIPVLFYFTGLHSDYHKPSDDFDKINYNGEVLIIDHIVKLIESMDSKGKIAFTKTREAQTTTSARFSVSMGIMPDYTYAGTGVRADGVTEGRPASKAGLKTGDIIIQLGDYSITSMESYMQSLGKFKKGDKTKVKYKRGNETLEATVEF